MLPILPALLLLLMHGPSNIERLAREGRLPANLQAIHRDVAAVQAPIPNHRQAAIAAMLTGHDLRFAQVLIGLLQPEQPESAAPAAAEPLTPVVPIEPAVRPLSDGFAECRRTRDGPRQIA